jgi:hypothetical protein
MNVSSACRRTLVGLVAAATMLVGAPVGHAQSPSTGAVLCNASGHAADATTLTTDMVCSGDDAALAGLYHLNFRDLGADQGAIDGIGPNNSTITGTFTKICVRATVRYYTCVSARMRICVNQACVWVNLYICFWIDIDVEVCVWVNVDGRNWTADNALLSRETALSQPRPATQHALA